MIITAFVEELITIYFLCYLNKFAGEGWICTHSSRVGCSLEKPWSIYIFWPWKWYAWQSTLNKNFIFVGFWTSRCPIFNLDWCLVAGAQYISKHEIQKLEKCAATLLMGCSSGSLFLNGCYIPQGTSLSYLLAGSPVTIANLWEVTDKDINRFAKAMLDAWLKERLSSSISCAQCNSVVSEFEALSVKGKAKKVSRKKATERYNDNFTCNNHTCDHGKKIGSFMAQAREACTLPFLIGASPVCYGVPTGIRRKKHL